MYTFKDFFAWYEPDFSEYFLITESKFQSMIFQGVDQAPGCAESKVILTYITKFGIGTR